MMSRYLMRIMYDGTNFRGWQTQTAGRSVQADLISALKDRGISHPNLTGSGRTDAGVHAIANYAHFDYKGKMTSQQLLLALNSKLASDLKITGIWQVADSFNARYSATSRTYIYLLARKRTPLNRLYTGFIPGKEIKIEDLKAMSEVMKGSHNFTSLSKNNPAIPNHICNISSFTIKEIQGKIGFKITADRFLHHMVRRIVGTMVNLSQKGLGVETLKQILEEQNARQRLVLTAPAQGLYLYNVHYPDLKLEDYPYNNFLAN
ncbi:MAG: tRNA pseudouridine(38-40) synthase TruA [Candidatus Cloacimonadaceae bacterium]|jgi:tRNA pseudouridine38-40 synthase|nr:tRNA pseudouridine(38-40) synthase TruA [Candidatus Cloacimonadota bacterium]MDD5624282.1 tRNA pseudouridine(38-40) synthase TruA [Candidatus Cloacimonadota bacterium]MDY0112549.1 tRNA pseudouridine(38-40) synthase TruA [Candidatus Syntrophosphaera sp.]